VSATPAMRFNIDFVRQAAANCGQDTGLSGQAELARLLGVSREAVRQMCDGVFIPTPHHIDLMCDELHMAPEAAWLPAVLPTEKLGPLMEKIFQGAHFSLRHVHAETGIALGTLSEIKNGKRKATPAQDLALREFARDNVPMTGGLAATSQWAARQRGRGRRCPQMNLNDDVLKHFRLKDDPFRLDVRTDKDVFPLRDFGRMQKLFTRVIERHDFGVVAGPTGSGKSVMARRLVREIARRRSATVKLVPIEAPDVKQVTASTLCDALVDTLAPGTKGQIRTEKLARQVCRILIEHHRQGNLPLLLIDDAHRCTPSTLSQLKRFWEFRDLGDADPYSPLLAIILLGWPGLATKLRNNPALLEVARRADIVELRGLRGQHAEYIRKKLARVGGKPTTFAASAIKQLARIPQAQWPLPANRIASRAMYWVWYDHKVRKPKERGVVLAADIARAAEEVV